MDRLDSSIDDLHVTLAHFAAINVALSASRRLIRRYLFADLFTRGAKSFSMLDIGSGSGDIARWIVRWARSRGIGVSVTCIDHDYRVVAYAEEANRGYPEISVVHDSAESLEKYGSFDYVFANHFLHHLRDDQLLPILSKIRDATRHRFLVNDLLRSRWSYAGYSILTSLFLRRGFTRTDGLLSIAKGFRREDFEALLGALGPGVHAGTAFPGRVYLWSAIERSTGDGTP